VSGYKGSRLIIGRVEENTFRLRKRRYSRNDFAGIFYERFEPEQGGTRIEGYFDMPRCAKYFMRIWLAFAVLIGTPIFVGTLSDIATHRDYITAGSANLASKGYYKTQAVHERTVSRALSLAGKSAVSKVPPT
jgi:hypothetical protein